ncbi:MAG: hypothetical protein WAN74_05970 [Thermoplasmata archaeon]
MTGERSIARPHDEARTVTGTKHAFGHGHPMEGPLLLSRYTSYTARRLTRSRDPKYCR